MTRKTKPLTPEISVPSGTPDTRDNLQADAQDSIAKALWLFENGEKAVAVHMFERLRQRVLQAGPVAMLISGGGGADDRAELQTLVSAVADIATAKPEQDDA